MRYFSRRYRVVTWNYRGYPPSEVPKDADAYSIEILVEDLRGLMQHLGIRRAHVGGLSLGGGVTVNFGIRHPDLAASLIICGAGSGSDNPEEFLKNAGRPGRSLRARRGRGQGAELRHQPGAPRLRREGPRGHAEFMRNVLDHSGVGSALMARGIQMKRKTIYQLEPELKTITAPALVVVGDQDEPCLGPGLFMKKHIPHAGLVVAPMTGHTVNIEEPGLFNQLVAEFLTSVESGRYGTWKGAAR